MPQSYQRINLRCAMGRHEIVYLLGPLSLGAKLPLIPPGHSFQES